jgi:hypothetical protein
MNASLDNLLAGFDFEELSRFSADSSSSPERLSSYLGKRESWVERRFWLPLSAARVVDRAIKLLRERENLSSWQALEFICADFLAGSFGDHGY